MSTLVFHESIRELVVDGGLTLRKVEDTKVVIKSCKSKNDRQYSELQNAT